VSYDGGWMKYRKCRPDGSVIDKGFDWANCAVFWPTMSTAEIEWTTKIMQEWIARQTATDTVD